MFPLVLESKIGVVGTLIYSWLVRNAGDNLNLQLVSEVGGSLVGSDTISR